MRFCSKLPCRRKENGSRYLMQDSTRFHHRTEFLYSSSRHAGLMKFSTPPLSLMTERISFCRTHGDSRSHMSGDDGPFEPMKVGEELCTQKCGTKFCVQFGHDVVYSLLSPGFHPSTTSSSESRKLHRGHVSLSVSTEISGKTISSKFSPSSICRSTPSVTKNSNGVSSIFGSTLAFSCPRDSKFLNFWYVADPTPSAASFSSSSSSSVPSPSLIPRRRSRKDRFCSLFQSISTAVLLAHSGRSSSFSPFFQADSAENADTRHAYTVPSAMIPSACIFANNSVALFVSPTRPHASIRHWYASGSAFSARFFIIVSISNARPSWARPVAFASSISNADKESRKRLFRLEAVAATTDLALVGVEKPLGFSFAAAASSFPFSLSVLDGVSLSSLVVTVSVASVSSTVALSACLLSSSASSLSDISPSMPFIDGRMVFISATASCSCSSIASWKSSSSPPVATLSLAASLAESSTVGAT
mmetsp:Transcript_19629/g.55414  ORF Transcript_19629/g.55414 Transcript_19629/m.55414 type:complete len:475 (+) Transcript_19629:235-1659(+)